MYALMLTSRARLIIVLFLTFIAFISADILIDCNCFLGNASIRVISFPNSQVIIICYEALEKQDVSLFILPKGAITIILS